MHLRTMSSVLIGAMLAILAALPASAQTTGQIQGTVLDAQAATVPGATVTATSPQLQGERTTVTDTSGAYRFATLPPGVYTVKATLSGFQPAEQTNVTVSLDQTVTLNFKLIVGGLTSTVDVKAEVPPVDTTSASGTVRTRTDRPARRISTSSKGST